MTTIEHALLGVNGALALGLHRSLGWSSVAVCGFAAIAPDWDGLPMLIDMAKFESGHRVWGHNIFACAILGVSLGTIDWRFRWSDWIVQKLSTLTKSVEGGSPTGKNQDAGQSTDGSNEAEVNGAAIPNDRSPVARTKLSAWWIWSLLAILAAMTQIPADVVVSGGQGLSDWPLKPLWPASDFEFVYPMVPWGNVGVTVIFGIAMIAMAKSTKHIQAFAIAALVAMVVYLVAWKMLFG